MHGADDLGGRLRRHRFAARETGWWTTRESNCDSCATTRVGATVGALVGALVGASGHEWIRTFLPPHLILRHSREVLVFRHPPDAPSCRKRSSFLPSASGFPVLFPLNRTIGWRSVDNQAAIRPDDPATPFATGEMRSENLRAIKVIALVKGAKCVGNTLHSSVFGGHTRLRHGCCFEGFRHA